jgi:hypothetical protein
MVKARLRCDWTREFVLEAAVMVPPCWAFGSLMRTPFFVVLRQNLPNIDMTYHMLLKDCANL